MNNIYEYAYQILFDISASSFAMGDQSYVQVSQFLTSDTSEFENIFEDYSLEKLDRNSLKAVMMLTIVSCAYLVNLYDIKRKINLEEAEMLLTFMESLTPDKVVTLFVNQDPAMEEIFDLYNDYINNTYIYRYCCWRNVLIQNKQQKVLDLNPFAVLATKELTLEDGFIETELAIQLFSDVYDKAIEEYSLQQVDEEDAFDSAVNFNENDFISVFHEIVFEHFANDLSKIHTFYSLILGNIYEYLSLSRKNNLRKKEENNTLLNIFEQNSSKDLVNKFINDNQFASEIINRFLAFNDFLAEDDLINRRLNFMKHGNIKKLKDFNPYYEHDQLVLKRITEKNSNS